MLIFYNLCAYAQHISPPTYDAHRHLTPAVMYSCHLAGSAPALRWYLLRSYCTLRLPAMAAFLCRHKPHRCFLRAPNAHYIYLPGAGHRDVPIPRGADARYFFMMVTILSVTVGNIARGSDVTRGKTSLMGNGGVIATFIRQRNGVLPCWRGPVGVARAAAGNGRKETW